MIPPTAVAYLPVIVGYVPITVGFDLVNHTFSRILDLSLSRIHLIRSLLSMTSCQMLMSIMSRRHVQYCKVGRLGQKRNEGFVTPVQIYGKKRFKADVHTSAHIQIYLPLYLSTYHIYIYISYSLLYVPDASTS